ncbi:MAG: hypothetical protein EBX55_10245, partial [Betaproteobacteria bacterium]|nr:hypothetical protein [Betaproteobacteria bacterium]
ADDPQTRLHDLEQAALLAPEDEGARFDYVKLLLQLGQLDAARTAFAPALPKVGLVRRFEALQRWLSAIDFAANYPDTTRAGAEFDARIAASRRDFEARFGKTQLAMAAQDWTAAMDELLEILMRDGSRRAYSMASAPDAGDAIELHVRHMPGGKFTDPLFGTGSTRIKEKDILRFEGPMGSFFLREDSAKPMILLASGTGFAPIKAIVEHARMKSIERPMYLYWGGRRPKDLYQQAICERWAVDLPYLRFVPVISDAWAEDGWQGRSGWVHQAVIDDFPDLSNFEVYACGAPVMVDAARRDFVERCSLDPKLFFADAFTSAAD